MDSKINILDFPFDKLEKYILDMGEKVYRAKQVYKWVYKGIDSFEQMTDVSKEFRERLKMHFYIGKINKIKSLKSKKDSTEKFLFELEDGNVIESVYMEYEYGGSVCISTQVGCRMGCKFCASSKIGFSRNLSSGEIIAQVMEVKRQVNKPISNIVVMGIGEPLDNYDNLMIFLKNANNSLGLNIGYRHISVSTCGLIEKINKLVEHGIQITLSVSLHAPNDFIRARIMPIAVKYPIDKLMETCKIYTERTKRRMTFEYILISNVNDSVDNAKELVSRIKGMLCHVNLIPMNKIDQVKDKKSSKKAIEIFRSVLYSSGITTTVRRELGEDIDAACGQLRRSYLK